MKKINNTKKDQSTTETKKKEKKISFEIIKKLFIYSKHLNKISLKENKFWFVIYFSLFIVWSVLPSARNGSLALIINSFEKGLGEQSQLFFLLLFLIIGGFTDFFHTMRNHVRFHFGRTTRILFETITLKKIGEMDIATRESPEQNNLVQKINDFGIGRIVEFIERQFLIIVDIIEFIITSAILIYANWWCFALFVLVTIPELIIEARFGYGLWKTSEENMEKYRQSGAARNNFISIPYFIETKLLKIGKLLIDKFRNTRFSIYKKEGVNYKSRLKWSIYTNILSILVFGLILYVFFLDVINKDISVGTFIFFISSAGRLRDSLGNISFNLASHYQDALFVGDFFKLINFKPVVISPKNSISVSHWKNPIIEFNHIDFSYPESDKKIIRDFSLTIKPGENIAIIGENGSGKSTLMKLLVRAYDTTSGSIKINGVDIKDLNLDEWHGKIAMLSQEFARYRSFSVANSICFGRVNGDKIDYARVKEAAKNSESNRFIDKLDKKYDQIIGKDFTDGVDFSGGEWQKLALSRIFYRDAQIIILDEPTASLDAESEINVFERLEKIYKDRTIIFISHKFNTVRSADRICLIADGKIKEIGSHNELMKKKGEYARLFKKQAQGYSLETN